MIGPTYRQVGDCAGCRAGHIVEVAGEGQRLKIFTLGGKGGGDIRTMSALRTHGAQIDGVLGAGCQSRERFRVGIDVVQRAHTHRSVALYEHHFPFGFRAARIPADGGIGRSDIRDLQVGRIGTGWSHIQHHVINVVGRSRGVCHTVRLRNHNGDIASCSCIVGEIDVVCSDSRARQCHGVHRHKRAGTGRVGHHTHNNGVYVCGCGGVTSGFERKAQCIDRQCTDIYLGQDGILVGVGRSAGAVKIEALGARGSVC